VHWKKEPTARGGSGSFRYRQNPTLPDYSSSPKKPEPQKIRPDPPLILKQARVLLFFGTMSVRLTTLSNKIRILFFSYRDQCFIQWYPSP
jgi:hypothetical protein